MKIGKVQDYAGMTDDIKDPEYAAAIGLMLAMSTNPSRSEETHGKKASKVAQKAGGFLGGLFAKFK